MTRTRKTGSERREEIVRAVLEIVGEGGLSALSTAALAERVGLTTGAIFRHFASMDEVLMETVRRGVARIETVYPDPRLPPVERLVGLMRNRAELLGSEPGMAWLVRSDEARLALPPEALRYLETLVRHSRSFLLDALEEGMRDGSIRDDLDPDQLLVPLMGTLQALIGLSGVHGEAAGGGPGVERVLEGVRRLITPPVAVQE